MKLDLGGLNKKPLNSTIFVIITVCYKLCKELQKFVNFFLTLDNFEAGSFNRSVSKYQ